MDAHGYNFNGDRNGSERPPSQNAADGNPQKLRRLMLNREYAQRFRQKKQEYLLELIRRKADEEAKVALLAPQVNFLKAKIKGLQNENDVLRQKIKEYEILDTIQSAKTESLKMEKEMLEWLEVVQQPENNK